MNLRDLPSPFQLAGLIAAHRDGKIDGRLRLQKTVYLLQEAGVPLGYDFRMLHYGPYSEGLQAEAGIAINLGLAQEQGQSVQVGTRYRLTATEEAKELKPIVEELGVAEKLRCIETANTDTLELAATYRYYRALGYDLEAARLALRSKKASKASPRAVDKALELLDQVGIPR